MRRPDRHASLRSRRSLPQYPPENTTIKSRRLSMMFESFRSGIRGVAEANKGGNQDFALKNDHVIRHVPCHGRKDSDSSSDTSVSQCESINETFTRHNADCIDDLENGRQLDVIYKAKSVDGCTDINSSHIMGVSPIEKQESSILENKTKNSTLEDSLIFNCTLPIDESNSNDHHYVSKGLTISCDKGRQLDLKAYDVPLLMPCENNQKIRRNISLDNSVLRHGELDRSVQHNFNKKLLLNTQRDYNSSSCLSTSDFVPKSFNTSNRRSICGINNKLFKSQKGLNTSVKGSSYNSTDIKSQRKHLSRQFSSDDFVFELADAKGDIPHLADTATRLIHSYSTPVVNLYPVDHFYDRRVNVQLAGGSQSKGDNMNSTVPSASDVTLLAMARTSMSDIGSSCETEYVSHQSIDSSNLSTSSQVFISSQMLTTNKPMCCK